MGATVASSIERRDIAAIEAILRDIEPPAGVTGHAIEYGVDATGDPAVRIWFALSDEVSATTETAEILNAFARRVETAILGEDLEPSPYISFRTASSDDKSPRKNARGASARPS